MISLKYCWLWNLWFLTFWIFALFLPDRKGNSLFAEVDDQRQEMRSLLAAQKNQFLQMKKLYTESEYEIRKLKREQAAMHKELQRCITIFLNADKFYKGLYVKVMYFTGRIGSESTWHYIDPKSDFSLECGFVFFLLSSSFTNHHWRLLAAPWLLVQATMGMSILTGSLGPSLLATSTLATRPTAHQQQQPTLAHMTHPTYSWLRSCHRDPGIKV